MQMKTSKKDKLYCALAWGLCLCLIIVLFFFRGMSLSYRAATRYFLETINRDTISLPVEHLLYEGSFYISNSYFYSSTSNKQLVYLSGDGLYHKSYRCPHCDRESCALMYYSALIHFSQLSPCSFCSSEDIVY